MRWLHISDIHIDSFFQNAKTQTFIRHFLYGDTSQHAILHPCNGLQSQIIENPVDCIIFTGDLFSKGKWDENHIKKAIDFIKEIYKICSDAGKWNWNEDMLMDRFFYCPGNHDVIRDACISNNGIVTRRKDALSEAATGGTFSPSRKYYDLLTKYSFDAFELVMRTVVSPEFYISNFPHEYKLFQVTPSGSKSEFPIVGINTALTAGQLHSPIEIDKELRVSREEFMHADMCFDTSNALSAYERYHIAAQKKLGRIANDENNLCFLSADARTDLDSTLEKYNTAIAFGHHPISYFSAEAKEQFEDFADKNSILIYLCGHTHRPLGSVIQSSSSSTWNIQNKIHEITIGGIFLDRSNYNHASFSIGQLDHNPNDAVLQITIYNFSYDAFGNEHWDKHSEMQHIAIKPPAANIDDEGEQREDIIDNDNPHMQENTETDDNLHMQENAETDDKVFARGQTLNTNRVRDELADSINDFFSKGRI